MVLEKKKQLQNFSSGTGDIFFGGCMSGMSGNPPGGPYASGTGLVPVVKAPCVSWKTENLEEGFSSLKRRKSDGGRLHQIVKPAFLKNKSG